jgi:polysaccharide biosynthesis protein PslH
MRVFALSAWFPYPPINGSMLRVYHLLRALAERHEVDLAAFTSHGPASEDAVQHLRSFCRSVEVIARSPFGGDRLHRGRWLSPEPRSIGASYAPDVAALVRERVGQAEVAIGFDLAAARYLGGLDVPTIFEEAQPTMIEHLWKAEPSATRRLRRRVTWWKHRLYLKRLIARMEIVTVPSDAERLALLRLGCPPGRIALVPNAAESADLTRPRSATRPRVVFAGSVTYAANLDAVTWFLGEVLPRVKMRFPTVEFCVTGATDGVALDALPNRDWARFTGQVSDVKSVVQDAMVSVAPIRAGGGTRLKILEALALGTPVVSTRKGAEGLELEDGRHLLLADAPDAFAACVLRVLQDEALAARLSQEGRARIAEKYTWDVVGDRFNHVVTEAVERWRRCAIRNPR